MGIFFSGFNEFSTFLFSESKLGLCFRVNSFLLYKLSLIKA